MYHSILDSIGLASLILGITNILLLGYHLVTNV